MNAVEHIDTPNTFTSNELDNVKDCGEHKLEIATDYFNSSNTKHFEETYPYVLDDKILQGEQDMADINEKKLQISTYNTQIQSEKLDEEQKEIPLEVIFNLEEHLASLQNQLNLKIKSLGFSRSNTVSGN